MHYSKKVTDVAIAYLFRIANSSNKDLYDTNKKVYELLRYGKEFCDEDNNPITVYYINFNKNELNKNIYEIAEEVTVVKNNKKRPDSNMEDWKERRKELNEFPMIEVG